MSDYTQHIEDRYWDYINFVQHETQNVMRTFSTQDSDVVLSEAIDRFKSEYTCSARRFLMNYFQRQATSVIPQLGQYSFVFHGNVYLFSIVTDDIVRNLDTVERDTYIKLTCEIAAQNSGDNEKEWRPLARKVMLWNKKLELLSKEEAFRLGHGLRFSLDEMNDFLLRVMDNEDLSYAKSSDVIEAFCFLYPPANDYRIANHLKQEYAKRSHGIPKHNITDKPEPFTHMVEISLQTQIQHWIQGKEDVCEAFLSWMLLRAPFMDLPSHRAYTIYCRLASFAYETTLNTHWLLDEIALSEQVLQYCAQNRAYTITPDIAYRISDKILSNAAVEFDNVRKRNPTNVWRYITVTKEGRATAIAIGKRIPHLLLGDEFVTKADVLFMLWYICDLYWLESGESVSRQTVFDRVSNFWSAAEALLEMAHLPCFYAPHMMERCFLQAICTRNSNEESPFEIYEGLCEFVLPEKRHRIRQKQGFRSEKSRATLEKEVMEAYIRDEIDFEGVEVLLEGHVLAHGREKPKYSFTAQGIACLPNPEIIIRYPMHKTGARFDADSESYSESDTMEERFRFIYGLSLFLIDAVRYHGITCDFRTNYQKNVSLTIIRWDT